jgi:hypothetical protein
MTVTDPLPLLDRLADRRQRVPFRRVNRLSKELRDLLRLA